MKLVRLNSDYVNPARIQSVFTGDYSRVIVLMADGGEYILEESNGQLAQVADRINVALNAM